MLAFGCDGIEDCIQLPPLLDASDAVFFDSDIVGYDICDDDGSARGRGTSSELSTIGAYGSNDVINSIPKTENSL
jgi:hypothetical protein